MTGSRFFDGASGQVHHRRWPCADPVAGLVFLHGMGQHTGHYHRFARALGATGIEMWALDHVGHGLSEGEPGEPGPIDDLATNALLLADIAEGDRPGLPLAIMGHSLGAATAVAAVNRAPLRFAAVVLCGLPRAAAANPDAVAGVRCPVLVVHGLDDRRAPIDGARAWSAAVPGAELREYEDAGHDLLHEPVHRRVTSDVAAFIRSSVQA
ncbi:alpha/beta fold hydrolase [Rhodococcus sp. Q]|uniref:alpha/beta hydrolase n=1 Tax=Rhodococcus sp. Q TaxID=2502252 RepID=UPI0010F6144E|nr:alpha/beta fold hydrolase [Rhodococcus sp. Q]